uniref:Uncharacterized protein n=1 Tax=Arundo donax TaxID=35708 RepID=A0A0A9GHP3_ARUDO
MTSGWIHDLVVVAVFSSRAVSLSVTPPSASCVAPLPPPHLISTRRSWPVLRHLSGARAALLPLLHFTTTPARILSAEAMARRPSTITTCGWEASNSAFACQRPAPLEGLPQLAAAIDTIPRSRHWSIWARVRRLLLLVREGKDLRAEEQPLKWKIIISSRKIAVLMVQETMASQ